MSDKKLPNNDEVICPNCVHQFRAIPVNVQARIAELEAERDEWCAEARLLAGKLMERDAECIAERERREVAEALLRRGYTTAELIAHFARFKD